MLPIWQKRVESALRRIAVFSLCVALSACAAVPDANKIIDHKAETAEPAAIVGAVGPLTAEQSAAILKNIGASDALQRHLAIEQSVAESPLVAGNATHVLQDGDATFHEMFRVIRSARQNLNLEYFIFENVQSDGVHLSDLLIQKRRQGVAVNILYDSFGSGDTPDHFFDRLKKAGVKVVKYNPINPLEGKKAYTPFDRDHRKILVADGTTAIVGGINLSKTYQSSGSGRSGAPKGLENAYWHDTDIEIKGPVVGQVQRLFIDHWKQQKGPKLNEKNYFHSIPMMGKEIIRIIGSASAKAVPRYYVTLISAMRNAEKNIWLTTAYFVPTDEQMEELVAAARRGVDVRILVPNMSDSHLAMLMQHSHYPELLKAGVRIFETPNKVLHSKTVVIDGVWSVIGSSNFDYRSVVFNDEIDVVIVGQGTGAELERLFEQDCATAIEITRQKWKHRAPLKRFKEMLAPIWLSTMKANI